MNPSFPIFFSDHHRFFLNHIVHGFTTRYGGCSEKDLSSLDLRKTSNPEEGNNHQESNRQLLAQAIGIPLDQMVFLKQVHTTTIHVLQQKPDIHQELIGDGMISLVPGLFIAVLNADCVPVLIAHRTKKVVAAIHVGWRGGALGMVTALVNQLIHLGLDPSHCSSIIGPCIHFPYEVGQDVYDGFCTKEQDYGAFFCPLPRPNRYWFNLPGLVAHQLHLCGIGSVAQSRWNTYTHEHMFFSCRRSTQLGQHFGLLGSFIAAKA
jgi:YfiH family protein